MSDLFYELHDDVFGRNIGTVKLTQCDGYVTYPTPAGDERCPCMVFAKCDAAAVTTVSNPALGDVPACQRCADWSVA
jgi:hypothetical protein